MRWPWAEELKRESSVQRWPIQTAIWAFLTVSLLICWAVVIRQVGAERTQAEQAAIAQSQNRAVSLEQYVIRTLESADLVTRYLGYKFLIHRDAPREALSGARPLRLIDPVLDRELFAGAHVISPSGDLIATTLQLSERTSIAEHPVFKEHMGRPTDRLHISRPLPSSYLKGMLVHTSRRIRDSNGETLGFSGLQISPLQLLSFPEPAAFERTDVASVISAEGITLARREGNRVSSGQDLRGKLVMRMQRRNPNGTYLGPSSLDGHIRYFSHRRLKDYPVFVTAGVSWEGALAGARQRAKLYYAALILFTAASVAAALFTTIGVNARQRRAAALDVAYKRLAAAQSIAKIGDWEYDIPSGTILCSNQLCDMYGRDHSDDRMSVEEYTAYLDQGEEKKVAAAMAAAVATKEAQTYEVRVTVADGSPSHRHVIAVPTIDPDGRVTRIYGTEQDITDDKLIDVLQAQVAHLTRLESMNMMASTLAHELNQPLTAASNYLSGSKRLVASSGAENAPQLLEGLDMAGNQVHAAAQIIRRVREMVRQQVTVREAASVPTIVEDAISLLVASGACPRGAFHKELAPDAPIVWADPVQVQQVMVNLLRNACEAAGDGVPQVKVETELLDDGFVKIAVTDNGQGFSEPLETIVSAFGSNKSQGMGLGLSISRTIIEYYGGKLWVERSGPDGSVVAFSLPSEPSELNDPLSPG